MSKLDDIERQLTYGPQIGRPDVEWLIARVRKLESALTETQRNLRQLRKAQVAHVRLGLPMIDECITEALKED